MYVRMYACMQAEHAHPHPWTEAGATEDMGVYRAYHALHDDMHTDIQIKGRSKNMNGRRQQTGKRKNP